jgi:hypothetical protein
MLLECTRRLYLDTLWGRQPVTVSSTLRSVIQTKNILKQIELKPTYPQLGPFPVADNMGYSIANVMISKSR